MNDGKPKSFISFGANTISIPSKLFNLSVNSSKSLYLIFLSIKIISGDTMLYFSFNAEEDIRHGKLSGNELSNL